MKQTFGMGYQSFREIRTENIFYIDKTGFIKEWWEYADKVTLIARPRRFGKTLNMSMLEKFSLSDSQAAGIYLRGWRFGSRRNTGSSKGHIRLSACHLLM